MCRWLTDTGSPVLVHDLVYRPEHSRIEQNLSSAGGAETTNGDGFGLGWGTERPSPAVFRSMEPTWNDRNPEEISAHVRSPCVLAYFRAPSGSAVQRTSRHPFRRGRWLFDLALILGREVDPVGGVNRAMGLIEETGLRHGEDVPLQHHYPSNQMPQRLSDGTQVVGS